MKNSLLTAIICLLSFTAFSQAKPFYTQYILNNYILNPALSGIENYTDNHLLIMNSGGGLVYDVRSYGVNGKVFDGHSNKGGNLQKSGTYYYSLEYKDGNETKRKTGYIILKY